MTKTRLFSQSFSGGELSVEMQGHIGDPKYRSGAATMRNMVPKPQGAATRRPGTALVRETKESGDRKSCVRGFTFSSTDTTVIEFGHEHFRFYTDGAVLLYATPLVVASINTTSEEITFTAAHGLIVDDVIAFTAGSSLNADLPGGLTAGLTYFVLSVVNSTTITISTSSGGAVVNFTNDGTGTIRAWVVDDLPQIFTSSSNTFDPADVDINSETITTNAAQFWSDGQAVQFTTTGTLPAPLELGRNYYLRATTGTTFRLSDTLEQALSPVGVGPSINFTSQGTGVHTARSAYRNGESVFFGGGGGATEHGVYHAKEDVVGNAGQPPAVPDSWYLMPVDGVYEVYSPYQEEDIFDIDRQQSNDILFLTHEDYWLRQLRRESALMWVLSPTTTYGPSIGIPLTPTVSRTFGSYQRFTATTTTATIGGYQTALFTTVNSVGHGLAVNDSVYVESVSGGIGGGGSFNGYPAGFYEVAHIGSPSGGTPVDLRLKQPDTGAHVNPVSVDTFIRYASLYSENDNTYVVTAVADNGDESEQSPPVTATGNNLTVSGSSNTITWLSVAGASRYRIYKEQDGLFVLIGETDGLTFKDENIGNEDFGAGETPPIVDDSLGSDPPGPAAIGRFEQRTVLGLEQELWLTATNTTTSLTFHLPVVDTDRINFTLDSAEVCPIRHIVELGNLVVLTSTVEFVVTPVNQDAITPTSKRARAVTYIGCSRVKPLLINSTLLFAAARGGHIREFGRAAEGNYSANDVSIRAAHLFDNLTIVDSAMMKSPYPIAWWVSSSGILLGFTYAPEEGIGGWHWHDTDGVIESCCVVTEGTEDVLYLVVKRTIDGADHRFIERMAQFAVTTLEDAFHVDCGLTYSGSAATTISGLDHLQGETVSVFANGVVRDDEVVDSGAIVLATTTTKAHIGLPYRSELKTLPIVAQIDQAFGQGRTANVNRVWLNVVNSCRFQLGTNNTNLGPSTDIAVSGMVSTEVDVASPGEWTAKGQILIVQEDPVPLTIVSLCAEVSIG